MQPIDFFGYVGALCTLTAFFQVSSGRWRAQSLRYQITNLIAGVILIIYAYQKHAYANIFLNSVWCMVAIYGLYVVYMIMIRKRRPRGTKQP